MIIRSETANDIAAIKQVTIAAFADHPHSNQTEVAIIDALRTAQGLTLSLVAEIDGQIVGHVAISPITLTASQTNSPIKDWYGLGPISVLPPWQNQGIGSALIQAAIKQLAEQGGVGLVVFGSPTYYQRFGFQHILALTYSGGPAEYFLAQALGQQEIPAGEVKYHSAFAISN